MGSWKFFLVAVLLNCVLIEVTSITIGSLFGTKSTELSPLESDEEPLEESKKKGEHHHKPPKFPLPAIPLPAISLPAIPLPAIPKPVLPIKHKKPIKKEEIIIATKTVFVEVTKRVTTHPVCVAVFGVKPPCLPFIPHHHIHHGKGKDNQEQRGEDEYESESFIEPSASFQNIEPTHIFESDSLPEQNEGIESAEITLEYEEEEVGRSGRYLEVAKPTPFAPLKSTGEINEEPNEESSARLVDGLFHKAPIKKYTTKTLWVTKVEKLIDYRVTATLEVKNCIPVDLKIPFCSSPQEIFAPGFNQNQGVFIEGETGNQQILGSGLNPAGLISGLTGFFGLHKPNKHSKPFAHHKPEIHKPPILPISKPKPKVPEVHKTNIKPVHKPGIVHRDDIEESEGIEADDILDTADIVTPDITVEKEVQTHDE